MKWALRFGSYKNTILTRDNKVSERKILHFILIEVPSLSYVIPGDYCL